MAKPTEEEIEAWLNQVHEGPCCSDDQQECETKPEEPPTKSPS